MLLCYAISLSPTTRFSCVAFCDNLKTAARRCSIATTAAPWRDFFWRCLPSARAVSCSQAMPVCANALSTNLSLRCALWDSTSPIPKRRVCCLCAWWAVRLRAKWSAYAPRRAASLSLPSCSWDWHCRRAYR